MSIQTRHHLSIEQKWRLIQQTKECPLWSRAKLCQWARQEFRLSKEPSRSTICRILKNESAIQAAKFDKLPAHRKLVGKIKIPELDIKLWDWVQKRESNGICLSGPLLQAKARSLLDSMGQEDELRVSNGWLYRFKQRHSIREFVLHGEANDVDEETVRKAIPELLGITEQYAIDDIYNCDETGLFWSSVPTRTLGTKSRKGCKVRKQRVTMLLAVNASGTHKLRPYFIGTARKPRCFNGQEPSEAGYHYSSNRNAWMTGELFGKWLGDFNEEMKNQSRTVLMLVDNFAGHKVDMKFSNVVVYFLPANTTARLQPLDAGIISSFKRHYTALKMNHAIQMDEMGSLNPYHWNLRQSMEWTVEAWEKVSPHTIANCWRHVGFVSQYVNEDRLI